MVNPEKVVAFLDIAGDWDPSLAFVMGGALLTTFTGYKFILSNEMPLFDAEFRLPTRKDIDGSLIGGAALFGVGWGLAGLCPGPAIANLGFSDVNSLLFLGAMIGTIVVFKLVK